MDHRAFLSSAASLTATSLLHPPMLALSGVSKNPVSTGFFSLGRKNDHWWLISPSGNPFFSLGINHIDPASLRYPENIHIWRDKYRSSTVNWLKQSVAPNLKRWGFNTIGCQSQDQPVDE